MVKIVSLVKANVKGFMRNWVTVFLLIIFPLMLIGVIFFSISPGKAYGVSVGVVTSSSHPEIEELRSASPANARFTGYSTLDECMEDLKTYRQYVCIKASGRDPVILDAYYDNTREPVILSVVQQIKNTVDLLQKEKTRDLASDFLVKFDNAMDRVSVFKYKINDAGRDVDYYLAEIDSSIIKLNEARNDLSSAISDMDRDVADMKTARNSVATQKNNLYRNALLTISAIRSTPGSDAVSSDVNRLESDIIAYNNAVNAQLSTIDARIYSYEQASKKGKLYLAEIDSGIQKLRTIRSNLVYYKTDINEAEADIQEIESDFRTVRDLDAETIVNPVVIKNSPTYVTESGISSSMQSLFPKVLFLIVIFLSLLVSSFICTSQINSSASQRISLIKGLFIHELVSIYASSMIIMVIPVVSILLLGYALFQIQLAASLPLVAALIFMVSSIFVLMGASLAYLIKKESITLLLNTFLLVFLVYFSGIVVPIESMGRISGFIAANLPSSVAVSTFNKTVFYGVGVHNVLAGFALLAAWFAAMFILAAAAKRTARTL